MSHFLLAFRLVIKDPNQGQIMTSRINYSKYASELYKKLFELSTVSHNAVDTTILDLINIRASQINGCAFCVDMHSKEAKIHGDRELRLYHVAVWRESSLFNNKERAALEWTEALTKLGNHGVSDQIFKQVSAELSEAEIAGLTFAIGVINVWNRLNIASPKEPGSMDKMLGLDKANLG